MPIPETGTFESPLLEVSGMAEKREIHLWFSVRESDSVKSNHTQSPRGFPGFPDFEEVEDSDEYAVICSACHAPVEFTVNDMGVVIIVTENSQRP